MSWFPWKKDKRMHNWEEEPVEQKPVVYSTSTPLPEPQEFKPPTEAEKMKAISMAARKQEAEDKERNRLDRLPAHIEHIKEEILKAASRGDRKVVLNNRKENSVWLTEEDLYEHFEKQGYTVEKNTSVPDISWE